MSPQQAAIYCRLSQEDREKPTAGVESRSIQNQRRLLLDYAAKQGWTVAGIYIDEDYSGSDRQRPGFHRLLKDAEAGKFQIVLCKSQSRFTRELELVEKYIHGNFVDWGIRFIGVADHVDSARRDSKKARQLSGLINEWYLEDLSDSIKAVLRSHQQQGRHIGSFAPYGYRKDPNCKGHLLIDEEAAATVRRIFQLYIDGKGSCAIAGILNREGVPNPSAYKAQRGSRYHSKYGAENSGLWHDSSIAAMLQNPLYIGSMVQHRSEKLSYKSPKLRTVPREEWCIVPDCHEAIISPEIWAQAQARRQNKSRPSYGGRAGIFAGKLRCLYCGRTLRRCKSGQGHCYYRCSGAQLHSGCMGGFIPHEELARRVWKDFSTAMERYFDPSLLPREDEMLLRRLQENESAQKRLCREFLSGKLREDWYADFSTELKEEQQALQAQLSAQQMPPIPTELSAELIDCFIESISVGKRAKRGEEVPVEIKWKF